MAYISLIQTSLLFHSDKFYSQYCLVYCGIRLGMLCSSEPLQMLPQEHLYWRAWPQMLLKAFVNHPLDGKPICGRMEQAIKLKLCSPMASQQLLRLDIFKWHFVPEGIVALFQVMNMIHDLTISFSVMSESESSFRTYAVHLFHSCTINVQHLKYQVAVLDLRQMLASSRF